jgi:hypothetical protein
LLAWGGPTMEKNLRVYVERIGWFVVFVGVLAFLYFRH